MKIKDYNLIILVLILFIAVITPEARAGSATSSEYQIKAAFLYNFIKFIDWPREKVADHNEPIIVGVIGKSPFGNAFVPIKDRRIKGRDVVIKQFETFDELKKSGEKDKSELRRKIEEIRQCHLLFVCSSEKKDLKEIIDLVKDHYVLTVGEMTNFIESGGITNLLVEEKKVGFEINVTAAKRAGLKIRSQLLRLAKRVVDKNSVGRNTEYTERYYTCNAQFDNKT